MAGRKRKPRGTRSVVGYVRVSTDEQAREGFSLGAQEQRIRAYCQTQGLVLGEIVIDAGLSGKSLQRPGLQGLRARMAAGEIGAVIVVRLDRLSRRTRDVLTLVEDDFKAQGVDLISVSEQLDTRTPSGMLMLTLLGALAQMERELIGERTRDALQQKRSRGERLGATPLGLRTPAPGAPMELDPAEAEAVREILRRRRRGESYRAIANALQKRHIPSKRGGTWAAATVRGIWLRRGRYQPFFRAA